MWIRACENISEVWKTEDNQSNMSDIYDEYNNNYDEYFRDQSLDKGNSSSENNSFKRTIAEWLKRGMKVKYKYKDKHKFNLD